MANPEVCPIDCSHTEQEKAEIIRKMNRPEVNWDDPMTRKYGRPDRV